MNDLKEGAETHLSDSDSDSEGGISDDEDLKEMQKQYQTKTFDSIRGIIFQIIEDEGQNDLLYQSQYCDLTAFLPSSSLKQNIGDDIKAAIGFRLFFVIIAMISMTSSFVIAATIFKNKKLQAHPSMLIALLSVALLGSCFSLLIYIIGSTDFICYFKLADLFQYYTTPMHDPYTP